MCVCICIFSSTASHVCTKSHQKAYTLEIHVLNHLLFSIESIFYMFDMYQTHTHTHRYTKTQGSSCFFDAKHPSKSKISNKSTRRLHRIAVCCVAPCRGYTPEVCPLHFVPRFVRWSFETPGSPGTPTKQFVAGLGWMIHLRDSRGPPNFRKTVLVDLDLLGEKPLYLKEI